MEMKNKEVFAVFKSKEGKYHTEDKNNEYVKIDLAVKRPNNEQQQEAQKVYARAFREFVESGAIVRPQLDAILRSRNMWDDVRQKESNELTKKINDNVSKLKKGGIKFSDAIILAKNTIKLRNDLFKLTFEKNQLDQNTAEAQAENVRFNYLTAVCTMHNDTGKSFFENYEDYKKQDQTDNPVISMAGEKFWQLISGLEEDFRKDWAEYKFLLKYKLCNDKLQLIDKQGRFVDLDGNYIDEQGRFVRYKDDGTYDFINREGEIVDKNGELLVETQPFLDEEGNPIEEKDGEINK